MKRLRKLHIHDIQRTKFYFQAEKESYFLDFDWFGDEIYSTVDACNTALRGCGQQFERLQQVIPDKLGGIRICKRTWHSLLQYFKKLWQVWESRTDDSCGARETWQSGSEQMGYSALMQGIWEHYAECRKPSGLKTTVHKEKMIDVQTQEVSPEESSSLVCLGYRLSKNAAECVDEVVALANLIETKAVRNTNVLKQECIELPPPHTTLGTPQVAYASRNTNPHMSKSLGVIHTTSVSRPQLKCYQVKDKVMPNNSQVKFQKKEVEDHHRISSISKKTKSVTAYNDSSNSRTSNENAVCAECGTCVVYNSSGLLLTLMHKANDGAKSPSLLCNFEEKEILGTCSLFGNDQFAPILGYGVLIQGNVTIKWVYYVKGLNHNLFSVGQFCDADLEVAFRKSIVFVRDFQGKRFTIWCHDLIFTQYLFKNHFINYNLFMGYSFHQLKRCYGIEGFLILIFDYISFLSKKEVVNWAY
ncbi:hypothetical protein Tco_0344960 [Tanacetum coccineum]